MKLTTPNNFGNLIKLAIQNKQQKATALSYNDNEKGYCKSFHHTCSFIAEQDSLNNQTHNHWGQQTTPDSHRSYLEVRLKEILRF